MSSTQRLTPKTVSKPAIGATIGEVWLREALDDRELGRRAKRLFVSWPSIERIAAEYAAFVSPWFPIDKGYLLSASVQSMVDEYESILAKGELDAGADPVVFGRVLFALFASSDALLSCRAMSLAKASKVWEPGSEPLAAYWERNGRKLLKFIPEPFNYAVSAPLVRMSLYARLLAFHELEFLQRAYTLDPRLDNQEAVLKETA